MRTLTFALDLCSRRQLPFENINHISIHLSNLIVWRKRLRLKHRHSFFLSAFGPCNVIWGESGALSFIQLCGFKAGNLKQLLFVGTVKASHDIYTHLRWIYRASQVHKKAYQFLMLLSVLEPNHFRRFSDMISHTTGFVYSCLEGCRYKLFLLLGF